MEISDEVKARVFATYWGTAAMGVDNNGKQYPCIVDAEFMDRVNTVGVYGQLILTDLSQISDEDAKSVGIIYSGNHGSWQQGKGIIHFMKTNLSPIPDMTMDKMTSVIDFLRSHGYMLPTHGIPDLFEAGLAIRKQ